MEVNVNVKVKAKLTAVGLQRLIDIDDVALKTSDYNKETGLLTTQLWHLFQIFGEVMYMGSLPYFQDNIITIENE